MRFILTLIALVCMLVALVSSFVLLANSPVWGIQEHILSLIATSIALVVIKSFPYKRRLMAESHG